MYLKNRFTRLDILGRLSAVFALIAGVANGQTQWIDSQRSADETRFLFGSQIQRYSLVTKSWLPSVSLPRGGATAMVADASGAAVAYGTSIYRYTTDFTNETAIGSTSSAIQSLFLDGNLLIAVHSTGLYARITIFNRTTGDQLSTRETYVDSMYGASHAPETNRLFGRTQGISPADIVTTSYTDAGVVANVNDGPYHGSYPGATKTWVFPNEARVVDSSGTVYSAEGLAYVGSLAGTVTDIVFNGDVPIVLRGGEVIAFTNTLVEAGRAPVGVTTGAEIQVAGGEAFVFSPGSGSPSVRTVTLSSLNAPEPGQSVDPNGLPYTIDDAFADKDGNILLFSKAQLSLFRWSPTERKYTGSFPLVGVPDYAAYSAQNHSAYFGYASQVVRKMDLGVAKPAETPLLSLPQKPSGLATAGEFIFAADPSGAWSSHYVISPAGDLLQAIDWNYESKVWEWDPVKRRMYFFRDDTSPNDLHYETISEAGLITGKGETPYHGDFTVTPPIRVNEDGSKVVIGSGIVFNTDGLTKAANLSNGFTDAVWRGDKLASVRAISGKTQLQVWEGSQFVQGSVVREFSGTPVRIFPGPGGPVIITSVGGEPRFTMLDENYNTIFISPTKPLAPATLAVTGRTDTSMSLTWSDQSDNEDSFRVERRVGSGPWSTAATVPTGSTQTTVTGLSPGTLYEFRVSAVLGDLVSSPSNNASALTLTGPDQPVGEPYNLRVIRIFNNSVTLEWQDNANNETAFRITRSTTAGGSGTITTMPAGSVSAVISGLSSSTTYYFRVQVVNGTNLGDLSAEVSARTMGSASAPFAPGGLKATANGSFSVSVTWTDNSTNENEFIVERTGQPASSWTEIGRVPYNTTAFTDPSVMPNTGYSYRVKSANATGTNTSGTASVTTPKLGGEFSGFSARANGVHYFAFSGPSRIERYDLETRAWLTPVPLQATVTALWVDDFGIYVAEDRAVIRFAPDGTSRTPLGNAQATVRSLFTVGEVLCYGGNSNAYLSVNRRSGLSLTSFNYSYAGTGHSIAPALNRVFFRSSGVSPSDIHYLDIGQDGKLIAGKDSPYHGSYPSGTRTFVFPNGARVADDSGTVYSTGSLSYNNSLGTSFTDLDFHGADVPIVLRGNRLQSYSNALLEAGSHTLTAAGLRISVHGGEALVFIADGASTRGLRVESVPLSALAAPKPGDPVDPRGLAYTPDDVFVDSNGDLLLFSKSQLSVFRWSRTLREYTPSLPLLGAPEFAAYSKENHSLYFAYSAKTVRALKLASSNPSEAPLFNLPSTPRGLATAGDLVFAADATGPWNSHYLFSSTGQQRSSAAWNYYSRVWQWDPVKRRMYFFRDDTSPNDLLYETISETGEIMGKGETPYHGDFTVTPPIRVSPDGSGIVIGSGVMFESAGMTRTGTLANTFTDALWQTGRLLTIRSSAGATELQSWNPVTRVLNSSIPGFTGTPLRLLALDEQTLALITLHNGVPRIHLLDPQLNVTHTYISPTGQPPFAFEEQPYEWRPALTWKTLAAGPVTVTAETIPSWLQFANGIFTGTPQESDTGGFLDPVRTHPLVLKGVDANGKTETLPYNVFVQWRNDAPAFTSDSLDFTASDRGDDLVIPLTDYLNDPDAGETHTWRILSNSNPGIVQVAGIAGDGTLTAGFASYVSGGSVLEVEVADSMGDTARTTLNLTLPPLPQPKMVISQAIVFNRANGLFEQKVVVTNTGKRAIAGFDVTVKGLKSGVVFQNATVRSVGGGVLQCRKPVAAGASVAVTLQYYYKLRDTIPLPTITVKLFTPALVATAGAMTKVTTGTTSSFAQTTPAAAAAFLENQISRPQLPFAITGIWRGEDGSVRLQFPTDPGALYQVQYSPDLSSWNTVTEVITGTGADEAWVDRGPPSTESHPASSNSRFYRVQRVTP